MGFENPPWSMALQIDDAELVHGAGIAIPNLEVQRSLIAAAAKSGHPVHSPAQQQAWVILLADVQRLGDEDGRHVQRQLIMSADAGFALAGSMEAWVRRARGKLPAGLADQLDALRVDARNRLLRDAR